MLRARKPLSEVDCYRRCYAPGARTVRLVEIARAPRRGARVSGERLRRMFEQRLDARDPSEAYEAEAA